MSRAASRFWFVFRASRFDNLHAVAQQFCTEAHCCLDLDGVHAICKMRFTSKRRESWVLKVVGADGTHIASSDESEWLANLLATQPPLWVFPVKPVVEEEPAAKESIVPIDDVVMHNNISQVFNLNVYLQDKCHGAPNLQDFVDSITASLTNIDYDNDRETWDYAEKLAHMPYADGVAKLLTDRLSELPQTDRPIQCIDEKRGRFQIKHDGMWNAASIDDSVGTPLRDAIHRLGQTRAGYALQWKRQHALDTVPTDAERTHILQNVSVGATKRTSEAARRSIASAVAKHTLVLKN
jgi:hypothetical protein